MKYLTAIFIALLSLQLFASDNYPRSKNIDVISYSFVIHLYDSSNVIEGEADILVRYLSPGEGIYFDLVSKDSEGKGMFIDELLVDNNQVYWEHKDNRVYIKTADEKAEGQSLLIRIKYSGIPADGLIISKNRYKERTFFADNWPDRARNWIPCVDHPSDKALVEFKVYTPSYYKVVSNGSLVEETPVTETRKYTHWKEQVPIPTKVMVIGVARFATQLVETIGETDIWTYVFQNDSKKGFSDYAIATAPYRFYSDLIGPYPYEKLANVQSKTMFGGMENAGCIFYAERTVSGRNMVESLMAHEIAHQWFGNSISEFDWHHIWLSEGFATYFTSYYLESRYGEEKMKSLMQNSRSRVIRAYERRPAPVIDTTISDFMRLLNTNSYQKGAWVLHMLREELGNQDFIKGIRLYYERFQNSNALTRDFRTVMEEVSGRDLDQYFEQWLYQPYLPELSMEWEYSPAKNQTTIVLKQEQEFYTFDIPVEIEIVTGGKSVFNTINLDKREETLVLKSRVCPDDITLDPNVKLLFINGNG